MNTKLTFVKFINFFLVFISLLMAFNIFFGDKNIFLLQEKRNYLKKLKNEISETVQKKNKIDFFLEEFNESNSDFLEILIKEELNYKDRDEKIFYYN